VYPNPASSFLQIDLPEEIESTNFLITFYSLDGRQVNDIASGTNTINIGNLEQGNYLAKITSEKGVWTKSFLKF
jgi:hypothetical protein